MNRDMAIPKDLGSFLRRALDQIDSAEPAPKPDEKKGDPKNG